MKKVIISASPDDTYTLSVDLGKKSMKGDVFALRGNLGTGKTIMAKGIASGLGVTEEVTSPTFNLMEEYQGRVSFYHFDLYRIQSEKELDHLFFEEFWDGDGVSVIEWPERAGGRLPANAVTITMEYVNETSRRITIEQPDN